MEKTAKILLAYHKKDILFKDHILTPVHAGRALALKTKPAEDKDLRWLLDNTLGDDTGDNISKKNPLYNEMTAIYWAWKNYDKLGYPDYLGFMHYRRHFIFKDMQKPVYECVDAGEDYYSTINYDESVINEILSRNDFICAAPQWCQSVYLQYKENHDIGDLNCVIDIIKQKFPDYHEDTMQYLHGNQAYYYNMFVFDKQTFFQYCHWLFSITFELEKRRDLTGKRLFVSERLTGIFITHLLNKGKKCKFLPVMYAEGNHEIPVIMAADDNYAYPMFVSLASLFSSANENTTYKAYLLLDKNFTDENFVRLKMLQKYFGRHKVEVHVMDEKYDEVKINIDHIKTATFYRLELPNLLPDVNKCIYLDVDTIVNKDLSELFRLNIDDKYIAGVRAAGYYYPEEKARTNANRLGIDNIFSYVNAGVLLLNLKKMRKDNLMNVFSELLKKDFPSMDQDILNSACFGKIRILHPKYNAMTKYSLKDDGAYKSMKHLQLAYTLKEWDYARKHPAIIHYADKIKPWDDLTVDYADKWWRAAAELPFFIEIYQHFFEQIINAQYKLKLNNQDLSEKLKTERLRFKRLKVKYNSAEKTARRLENSNSYKLGRFLSYPYRKIKGGLRCLREHGLGYTTKRIVTKIKTFKVSDLYR
ncbi:MAG: DUF4422 domain-containing protein [Acidaminococcaceae bacterium]|nr:DUF4422 domain-containing protein [Acidaminococcaceae bacterium]